MSIVTHPSPFRPEIYRFPQQQQRCTPVTSSSRTSCQLLQARTSQWVPPLAADNRFGAKDYNSVRLKLCQAPSAPRYARTSHLRAIIVHLSTKNAACLHTRHSSPIYEGVLSGRRFCTFPYFCSEKILGKNDEEFENQYFIGKILA